MSTEVKPTDWDAEDNRWEPTPSGGGSGLPPYTSADKGKFLGLGEGEGNSAVVIVPEQSVTLTDNGVAWVYIFGEDSGVNSSFFESASVGDKCNISLDGATAVESTAVDFAGNVLFPIGDFYLGYAPLFGGVGVASLNEPVEKTHTISGTALIPNVELKWAETFSIPHIKEGGNGTYVYNNKSYGNYQDCSEMIKRYPVVILEKGINNWVSCGFVDEYTTSRHAAQYCFNVWNNGSVSLLKLGFEIDNP